ncbi:MAG: serine/threonine-protein kinase [Myxococcota bacterium]
MRVGPYELDGVLGAGGMGTVHKAHHSVLHRDVAVKELTHADPQARTLFIQEAQLLFGLKHPNFPTVLDLIESRGRTFLVMDYVQGPSLGGVIKQRCLQGAEAVLLGQGLCRALEFLHGAGVLHRDVKPDNILLPRGLADPVLVDFGIAGKMGAGGPVAFTPGMAAPEQVSGGVCGPPSDVYQVGATLFACLTGEPPRDATARTADDDLGPLGALLDAQAGAAAQAIRNALRLQPAHRPATAKQMHDALAARLAPTATEPAPSPSRKPFDIRR